MKTFDDKNRLLEIYVHGIDSCLSNDFPTDDYIRENFVGRMEEYGVHLDESLNTANDRRVVVLGRCIGQAEINNSGIPKISVKRESDLIIIAKGSSFVIIDIFDDPKLRVIASADSKICANHYGGTLKTESLERTAIKAIEKHKKIY